jgi:cation diffusion facilitator CzcD-associated flavoprotein CzcO
VFDYCHGRKFKQWCIVLSQIAIIGSGFGGIGLAIRLKKAGIGEFTIYERADEIGGVWRDNTYPGAACDVPSRMYSYSFEAGFPWSDRFGGQAEILSYLKYCVEKYGIGSHIRFRQDIRAATFDEGVSKWRLQTADGTDIEADICVSAVGLFNQPRMPDIPGMSLFDGPQFHSARWGHDCELDGRSVAVIGTGASAIQFVPAIAPKAGKLSIFQRSPQYVMPRDVRPVSTEPGALAALKHRFDRLGIYADAERRSRRRGSPKMTALGQAAFAARLEREIPDPELRRMLTPSYPLGCKRVLQSNDWYPALQRPNVELVDAEVTEITAEGALTGDGKLWPADVIIYGTGFTPTRYLTPMQISGADGADLNAAWRDGAEAYLGMTVAGFPNFFMMYGPNTNVAGSIIYMLESQARYIVSAVRHLQRGRARRMTVRDGVQRRFNDRIQARLGRTVLVAETCHSYFQDPSGKITTQWPGFMLEYRHRTRRIRRADYDFA